MLQILVIDSDGATIDAVMNVSDDMAQDILTSTSPQTTGKTMVILPAGTPPVSAATSQWNAATQTTSESLAGYKNVASTKLKTQCLAVIGSGFSSSALGSVYYYGSQLQDQLDILRCATLQGGGSLFCSNDPSASDWPFVIHTQAQAAQVLSDFGAMSDAARTGLDTQTAALNAQTTIAAVQTVSFQAPAAALAASAASSLKLAAPAP